MTTRLFFILLAALFLHSFSAFATITVQSVIGASAFDPNIKPYQIFGGTGGDETVCTGIGTTAGCNTCINDLLSCNTDRIYGNRHITITILSDTIADGTTSYPFVRVGTTAVPTVGAPSTVNAKNTAAQITMRWIDLCQTVESSATGTIFTTNCEGGAINASLTVGFTDSAGTTTSDSIEVKLRVDTPAYLSLDRDIIDLCTGTPAAASPQQGICDFTMYPGDEKAYIESLKPFGAFPNSGTLRTKYLRFYYSTIGFADVSATSQFKQVEVDTTSSTSGSADTLSNKISDLQNDAIYYFRISTVDEAGNIADFTSDDAILNACDPGNTTGGDITLIDASYLSACRFMVSPSEVLGLLPKNFNCFITSAAYGSPMEPHVQLFQKFRSEILMKNAFGRAFTRWYYKYGPYPAAFLMQNPALKPVARAVLWPAYGVVWVSLNYGTGFGLLLSLLPLIAGILIIQISRKKSHATTPV